MAERKTEFWWASIHGADPEPVEKTEHEGRPCVYTLGCADPFYLDEEPCAVRFLATDWATRGGSGTRWAFADDTDRISHVPPAPLARPAHPDRALAEQAALAAERAKKPKSWPYHGWRGPR